MNKNTALLKISGEPPGISVVVFFLFLSSISDVAFGSIIAAHGWSASTRWWLCFMELLMITVMSTAVEVTEDTAYSLTVIIESYLFHFNQLYPDSMTPKTHYLLHLPEQMRQ